MLSHTNQNGYADQTDQEQGIAYMSPLSMIFSMNPTQPVYNEDGTPNLDAGMGNVKNPLDCINRNRRKYRSNLPGVALSQFNQCKCKHAAG